jgi:hypothetical protein
MPPPTTMTAPVTGFNPFLSFMNSHSIAGYRKTLGQPTSTVK